MIEMISPAVNSSTKIRLPLLLALLPLALLPLALLFFLSGCQPVYDEIEPNIRYFPQARQLRYHPSPFPPLTKEELREEWARELYIGLSFGREMDLYRAITAFKRALFLLPNKHADRRAQIEYSIFESYYLGQKYSEASETFENGSLFHISIAFPAYKEMCIMLYECYVTLDQDEKARQILDLLRQDQPETADRLALWSSFASMDFDRVSTLAACQQDGEELTSFVACYEAEAKSVRKARFLNGLMPGFGYLYVGQKQTAATSFLINALFTSAAYYFFKNGNVPMGIITASLESGWYLGGINGAGLAACEYNKRFYEENTKEMLGKHCLVPFLMLETSF